MARIRVLIVDDAVVVRRLVADALAADPDIEVVGVAANGRIALQRLSQVDPDVVTMDVDMPESNGIDTVRALRHIAPTLPVIMFSTLTERGGVCALEALSAGATDYVTKPTNVGSLADARRRVRDELIPRIKALATRRGIPGEPTRISNPTSLAPQHPAASRPLGDAPPAIVAIGVSTGGPSALAILLAGLPADLQVPIVVVQHMPAMFTRLLAERLDAQSALTVREGAPGMVVAPGTVTVAPGDYHMVLERRGAHVCVALNQDPPVHSCRPAVDPLFQSVVGLYGRRTLGVVLTGMGRDGLQGCGWVRGVGGQILAQDEASSVVWGMPGLVVRGGLANQVLSIAEMAAEIARRVSAAPLGGSATSSSSRDCGRPDAS